MIMRWIGWRIDRIGYASGIAYGKDAYQWMTRCTTCRPARRTTARARARKAQTGPPGRAAPGRLQGEPRPRTGRLRLPLPIPRNPGDTRGQGRAPADNHPVDAQPQGQPPMVEPPGRPHRQDQGAKDRRTMGQSTHARRQNGQILRRRVPDP